MGEVELVTVANCGMAMNLYRFACPFPPLILDVLHVFNPTVN